MMRSLVQEEMVSDSNWQYVVIEEQQLQALHWEAVEDLFLTEMKYSEICY